MAVSKNDLIRAHRQDIKYLNEEIEFQEEVIKVLLGYFTYETGIRSLENYLNATLEDSLDSTDLYLHIMERVVKTEE